MFTCVDPDPHSEFGSTQLLNTIQFGSVFTIPVLLAVFSSGDRNNPPPQLVLYYLVLGQESSQCCGSRMIYSGSGSSFEFSEFRIQPIGIVEVYLEIIKKHLLCPGALHYATYSFR